MAVPPFGDAHLQQICNVLADTNAGLTGSEIGQILSQLGVDDPLGGSTKRYRLFTALSLRQKQDSDGSSVVVFVQAAMEPVLYSRDPQLFEARREQLNTILAFSGYVLGKDGKVRATKTARTLGEAEQRAAKLRSELSRRGVHGDVLRFCQAELLQDNYFHAVLEATKSVAEKIRQKSGLTLDGTDLVDAAFGGAAPRLAINTLRTETERSEQRGFVNLLKGVFGTFRNTTAHAPKITWPIGEQDALDLMSLASYLHRRLDSAVPTSPGQP